MFRKMMMAIAALTILVGTTALGWSAPAKDGASVVATVNGVSISRQDFDREMRSAEQYFASQGQSPAETASAKEIKQAVIDKLVNGALLYEASKKSGIKIEQAALDAEFKGFKGRFPSDKEFKAALTQLSLDEAGIKEKIGQSLAVEKYINQAFVDKAKVTDQEVKDYYDNNISAFATPEQVRASHILITVKPEADAATKKEARRKLERLRKKIVAGGDFAALAKKNSDCPSNAKGGDLGYFSRGQMVKPFETAAFAMMPGAVSEIVETQFGYHLIKLTDKKHAETVSFDEARPRIDNYLRQSKAQKAMVESLKTMRDAAKITIAMPAD
ncbi:MAG: peptidylprolyl isomerase [Desulfobulbaceae bacterium]|nr:peptidylprolyl isomerase [Desulfobulbaceae bacterium]